MHRFVNILVYGRSEALSPRAMERLASLARKSGATIKLMDVIEPFPWYTRLLLPGSEEFQGMLSEHAAGRLSTLAKAIERKELTITTKVASGRPHIELIKEVLRSWHDLVVKVADPDQSNTLGSTDMKLLRNCPCPVLLLHPEALERAFRQILVAVDPPPAPDGTDEFPLREEITPEEQALNVRLMNAAAGLAELDRGELHVVHAWTAPGEELLRVEGRLAHTEVDLYVSSLGDEHRQAVERLLTQCEHGSAETHVHLIKGQPADVITAFAKGRHVDLIVMGTVVRTGIPGLLIGNTAETVFHQVECSVLAIKPETFVSPVTLDD